MKERWQQLAKISFEWIIKSIDPIEWQVRKEEIINILSNSSPRESEYEDKIGLYLFTIDQCINLSCCHNPVLAGRLYPFFVEMGLCLTELKQIKGITDKIELLVKKETENPISILYEMVVALNYVQKGWDVEFIPVGSGSKTADMKISKDKKIFYVECKFLIKDFRYKVDEMTNFKIRWNFALEKCRSDIRWKIFNINFKVPLENTGKECLFHAFESLCNPSTSINIYETSDMLVIMKTVDSAWITGHLVKYRVQRNSPSMIYLIFQEFDPYAQYAMQFVAGDNVYNDKIKSDFVGDIQLLCGAKWNSLSDIATRSKTRPIMRKINGAIGQIPNDMDGIIHVGYETADSIPVEKMKCKILQEQIQRKKSSKKASAIIVNAFMGINSRSPGAPSDILIDDYACRETVIKYTNINIQKNNYSLVEYLFCKNNDDLDLGFTHWEIDEKNLTR